jgi:hypothetical protein
MQCVSLKRSRGKHMPGVLIRKGALPIAGQAEEVLRLLISKRPVIKIH